LLNFVAIYYTFLTTPENKKVIVNSGGINQIVRLISTKILEKALGVFRSLSGLYSEELFNNVFFKKLILIYLLLC